jgi:hypothetical protein
MVDIDALEKRVKALEDAILGKKPAQPQPVKTAQSAPRRLS